MEIARLKQTTTEEVVAQTKVSLQDMGYQKQLCRIMDLNTFP